MCLGNGSKVHFDQTEKLPHMIHSMEKMLCHLIDALPSARKLHSRREAVYALFEQVAGAAVQEIFGPDGEQRANLPMIGALQMPFVSMGAINSTHLFGLDELIIFAFYARNRRNYRRVADIGANIGLHSIVLAKLGYLVQAFEPDSLHRELMTRNFALNGVSDRIVIHPEAVSTDVGSLEFVRVLGNTTGSHIAGAKRAPYGELETIIVPTASFREIMSNVDLIKLDVEGHELDILVDTRRDDWLTADAMVEVGTLENAQGIFDHMNSIGINMFSQKNGWERVIDACQMPISHKEGSLFISCRGEMNWS
jgi:FkbM family methyltransferase